MNILGTGNCNVWYVSGLYDWAGDNKGAMAELLTRPKPAYYLSGKLREPLPTYNRPKGGIYLFAQGSEDTEKTDVKYAPLFRNFILQNKLGTVSKGFNAPNPSHNNQIGTLYIWVVDPAACAVWWKKNVLAPAKCLCRSTKKNS